MPALEILEADAFSVELDTRMPFRYGISTVSRLTHAVVRVRLAALGREWTGVAADHLPPKWFTKDPRSAPEEDVAGLWRVIDFALAKARGLRADSPFSLWREMYDAQAAWGADNGLAPLLTHFGVTLVERAVLDAGCRALGEPFHRLLLSGRLGVRLDAVHPALAGLTPMDLLPPSPLAAVIARHTVGLSDPLTDADLRERDALEDGLPRTLVDAIHAYGLRHFKLKAGGDAAADAARIGEVLDVIAAHAPASDWAFSIDGNESYATLEAFREFWDRALTVPAFRGARDAGRLLFVEQPLHRDISLSPEVGEAFAFWPDRPPIVIDESDAALTSLPEALRRGYAGTSHKNCKGVFKGIANACLLARRRRESSARSALLSGEDLSAIGPVSLGQDLAVQAALGIESVERNGHHYIAGLAQFSQEVQEATLAAHPDLYHRAPGRNVTTLRVSEGRIQVGTINAAPFGVGCDVDPARFAARRPAPS